MILQVNRLELLSGSDGKLPYFIKNGPNWFVKEIATSKKSMISMTLKHQNWMELLSGSKLTNLSEKLNICFLCKKYFK